MKHPLLAGLLAVTASFSSSLIAQTDSLSTQPLAEKKQKLDSIWGFNSHGREVFEVVTDSGDIIKAVDVDGLAYSGDMVLGRTQDLKLYGLKIATGEAFPENGRSGTHAAIQYPASGYKWSDGVVPYVYAANLGSRARSAMDYAVNHWNSKTNVRFVPRTNQSDYILVQGGGGCSSWIGRQGGQQVVTLAEGCGNGAAVHELGHAVGFFHEQTRTDRDSYISIYWNNIQSGMEYNFYKMSATQGQNHGAYDYYSIMHYRTTAFGINGAVTIWPSQSGVDTRIMGNSTALSNGDITAAAAIYGAADEGTRYTGALSGANDYDIQPDGNWFQYNGGSIQANLQGPSNADFDLKLYRWSGSDWTEVARSESPTSTESMVYSASSGYYYFKIYSYSGSGDYTFMLKK